MVKVSPVPGRCDEGRQQQNRRSIIMMLSDPSADRVRTVNIRAPNRFLIRVRWNGQIFVEAGYRG